MVKMVRMMVLTLAGMYASLASAAGAMVDNPWIREAPPMAPALGAFMVLHNHTAEPLVLVGADSAVAAEVQLHRTVMEGGMARMVHQPSIEIPAHGSLEFKPGDYHLMLMQPKRALKAGEKVEITLKFKNGSTLPATFEVRAGMGMPMNDGKMMHHH